MTGLLYVTGNPIKFQLANSICGPLGVPLERTSVDIHEIQAETGEPVAQDKAAKAFTLLQQPLLVSDDSWMIPGLKNFPGPYMKSMNDWFSPEDWLRLTTDLEDRRITLRQIVVYQDADGQQMFTMDIQGILLHEVRGTSPHPHATVTSFDGGKHSNAEYHEKGENAAKDHHNAWHDFAEWYARERATVRLS